MTLHVLSGCLLLALVSAAQAGTDAGDYSLFGSASSNVIGTLKIGATTDNESSPVTNATATGDDVTGSDDEDGVTVPASIMQGASGTMTVNVTNGSGATAYLNVWIDFNRNGVLTDSGEQVAANTVISNGTSNSNKTVNFTVPAGASAGTAGVRVRLTSSSSPGSTGLVGNGEVEDYITTIGAGTDYGDWNGSGAATTTTFSTLNSNLRLGATVDVEASVVPNAAATTDDTTGTDDDDGVTMPASIVLGASVTIPVTVYNNTGANAYLNAWIDFGNDGTFDDTLASSGGDRLEAARTIATSSTSSTQNITFTVPGAMTTGAQRGVRFRLTNQATTAPTGSVGAGEVEDYVVTTACPTVTIAPGTLANATVGTAYSQATAFSASGGAAPYSFSTPTGIPAGMSWDSVNKKLTGTPTSAGTGNVVLGVTDANGCAGSLTVSFTRVCPTITVTFTTLTGATVGSAYSQSLVATGGTAAYTWTLVSGSWPAGLSMSSAGVVSGAPTASTGASSVSVTVRATDANSCVSSDTTVSIKVCDPITISPSTLPDGMVGTAYSVTFASTESGFRVQQPFSSTTINNLAQADALLSGTNRISNYTGSSATVNFIGSGAGDGNFSGGVTFPAGAGDHFALKATGYIVIPTAGTWTFGTNSDDGLRLRVDGSAVITDDVPHAIENRFGSVSLTAGTHSIELVFFEQAGVEAVELFAQAGSFSAYDTGFKLIGGTGGLTVTHDELTWSATGLPAGLTLSSAGVISGTPTAVTSGIDGASVSVTATDLNGCTLTQNLDLKICATITIAPGTLATGTVGTAYSQATAFSASGGTSPYTFATPTGLPVGMSWDSVNKKLTGTPTSAGTTSITISVTDANACPGSATVSLTNVCPTVTVSPSTAAAASIGTAYSQTISASGGTAPYTFAVSAGTLPTWATLNASTGVLSGTPTNSTSASFTIRATDANNCTGTQAYTIAPACPTISITPTTLSMVTQGSAMTNVTLAASGGTATYTWSLNSGSTLPTGLSLSSGGVLSGTPTAAPGTYAFTIKVTDAFACTGTRAYSLKICPVITVNPASLPVPTVGTAYSQTISGSGGTSPYTFSVSSGALPAWATLNATTGVISGTPSSTTSATFTITALDANSCPGTRSYTITPVCPTIAVTPTTPAVATVGTAYSQTITASGGVAAYTFSVSAGALPAWASLSATTGVISGTPNNTTTASFTITATDTNGCPATQAYTLTPVCPTITVTPTTLSNVTQYAAMTNVTFAASGGIAAYTWSLNTGSTLPAGLSLSSGGVLSGTPTATPGTYAFTVKATDANGCTGLQAESLTIACPTVTITTASLPNGTVGTAYASTMLTASTTGSSVPAQTYVWTVSPALPTGLALSSGGVLSGTPTVATATTSYTFTATNQTSCPGTRALSFSTVCPAITITPGTLANATVGSAYSQGTAFSASGGTAAYTFGTPTGIPAGMSWDATNKKLIGTPTSAGTGNVVVSVTDANGCTGSLSVPFTRVCPTITITPSTVSPLALTEDTTMSTLTFTASGGTVNYTWSTTGTLPTGLTFTPGATNTATITGAPTVVQSSTFTVNATDANGCATSLSYTITVGCPVITITPASIGPFTQYQAITNVTMGGSGGRTPYTWSASTLPAGLSLSSAGLLSGTATATPGTISSTISLTDNSGCPGSKGYSIVINCPTVAISTASLPNGTVGTAYTTTTLAASTAGTGVPAQTYTWSVSPALPTGMSLSSAGVITGTPTVATATTSYTFTATNQQGCPGTRALSFSTVCPAITITPTTLSNVTQYAAMTNVTFSASGGTSAYTWSLNTGSTLPAGLSLSSAGVLTGTPTATPGTYAFTVKATDANGCIGLQAESLTIACPTVTITTASLPNGTVGTAYTSTTLAATTSGSGVPAQTYAWSVSPALPTGLVLSSAGVLSGTPTVATATTSYTFTATNQTSCPGTRALSFSTVCPAITISPGTLANATVGSAYVQATAFSATGGTTPYTFGTPTGIPAGMSWDAANKKLIGTPTSAGTGNVVVSVTDANNCAGSVTVPFTRVCPTITVSPSTVSPLALTEDTTMSTLTFTASGGTANYTWSTTGTLPTGLTFTPGATNTATITGTPTVVQSSTFTVTATDANGCASAALSYTITVGCPVINITPAGIGPFTQYQAITNVTMVGSGGRTPYTWSSSTLPTGLSLSSAGLLSGTATAAPGTVSTTINLTDNSGCPGSKGYSIVINCPTISISTASLPNGTVGTAYPSTTLAASTAGTGVPAQTYAWSVSPALPTGMSLSSGGVISGTPTVATGTTSYTFTATNQQGCPGTRALSFSTVCPTVTVTPTTLSNVTQYAAMSNVFFLASGGTSAYTWSLNTGSTLPAGLSLSSGGVLSGTPTATPGTYSFTVKATDANGCTALQALSLTVTCPTVTITTASLPNGTVGTAYTSTTLAASTSGSSVPAQTYAWSVSPALPTGLALSSAGVLSGTPTVATSTTSYTFTATNQTSCLGTRALSFSTVCPAITLSPATLSNGVVGTAYTQTVSASGGTAAYTYSVSAGSLPAWASLNTSTGVISGTPNTTTAASFTIKATDANACFGTLAYSITPACPAIAVSPSTLGNGVVGSAYSQTVSASGGIAPYSFSVSTGSLPTWATLNAGTGVISGTPNSTTAASFTIKATDANACFGTRSFTVTPACPAITITNSATLPDGFQNNAYASQTLAATGGTAPYTWSVTAGALPTGLSLSSGGVVAGVPTAATGSYSFTAQAADLYGCTTTKAFTISLKTLSVGNLVWSDTNNNGLKDSGENGLSGITVQIWSAGTDGINDNGAGDDVKLTTDVTTDSNGGYLFTGLPAGANYYVRLPTLPATNALTSGTPVALDNGINNDNNGLQLGGANTAVRTTLFTLAAGTEADVAVDGDDTNGELTLDIGLSPTLVVGNLVFSDVNNNGVYDSATDTTIVGVTLKLFAQNADPLSSTPVATTVTGGGGLYAFYVRAGSYFVYVPASHFLSSGVLFGMKPTRGRTDNTVPNIDDNGDQNALATAKPMATGVRTGVFTLASGGLPTSATGETGHLSSADNTYDTDSNLTVDLGFYLLPPSVSAPLAGRVRRDLTGAGDPAAAAAPLPGVEVALYEDANGNGRLDADEMQAVETAVTDSAGVYAFDAVPKGSYLVVQTVLPGAEATFDSDGGDAQTTVVTMAGRAVADVNFLQAVSPDTFTQWQAQHDGSTDLLAYALGTDGQGTGKPRFWLEAGATVDAMLVRNTAGHHDVRYVVEGSSDLQTWAVLPTAPAIKPNTDGTETLRYAAVSPPFIRLKIELDANQDGIAEATAVSPVQGWSRRTLTPGLQTFSMPLLKPVVATTHGSPAYTETVNGTEITRPHWTVGELFPTTLFHAGTAASNADRVMFFDGTGYRVLWLMARTSGNRWVQSGDATLADAGQTIVGPAEGLMIQPRIAVTQTLIGEVRTWQLDLALRPGAQLIGTGSPLAQSPADLGLKPVMGDSIRLWTGDTTPGSSAYSNYLFGTDGWSAEDGKAVSTEKLLEPCRAAFFVKSPSVGSR